MQVLLSLKFFRFIAVLLVIYNHVSQGWLFGYFTIDAFFVLSGYMMAMVAENNRNPRDFAIGRITRIIPLYWGTSIALFIIAYFQPNLLKTSVANFEFLIKSLLFIPFFKLEDNITPFYTLTWTLLFEMYFYICVLSAMMIISRYLPKFNLSLMATIITVSVYLIAHLFPDTYAFAVFFKSQNFLQSLLGLGAYEIVKRFSYDDRHIQKYYGTLIVLTVGVMLILEAYFLKYRLFVIGIPCVILIVLMVRIEDKFHTWPQWFNKPMIAVSDASYAIYLTHLFAFSAIVRFFPTNFVSSLLGVIFIMVISSIVGIIVHHLYDVPVTKYFRQKMKSWFKEKPKLKSVNSL